jgi:potassium-dependent mechanosensitive channel
LPHPALTNRRFALFAVLLVLALTAGTAYGAATLDAISTQRSLVENSESLNEEQKNQALSRLEEARRQVEEAGELERQLEALRERLTGLTDRIATLRAAAAAEKLRFVPEDFAGKSLAELEGVRMDRQKALEERRKELAGRDRELSELLAFARTGSAELSNLEARQAEQRAAAVPEGNAAQRSAVDSLWHDARDQAIAARIALYRVQLDNLQRLTELAQPERDFKAAEVEALATYVDALRDFIQFRRQAEAEMARQTAQQALAAAPAALRTIQEKISTLAAEQAKLVTRETELDRRTEQARRTGEEIKRDYERIQEIAELGGSTARVSELLQKRRALVPSSSSLTRSALGYQEQISDAALRQLELDELLRETRDPTGPIDALVDGVQGLDETARADLRAKGTEAWIRYREVIQELWTAYTRHIGKLSALEAETRRLIDVTHDYRVFIDDRLLWMPSTDLIPLNELGQLLAGVAWYLDPNHAQRLLGDAWQVATERSPQVFVWLLVFVLLLAARRRARATLSTAATATLKVRSDNMVATLQALVGTLVLILPAPWFLTGAGLLLGRLPEAHEFTTVIGVGLQSAGHTLLFFSTLRHLCRSDGLARAHLQWSPALCTNMSRQAVWLSPLVTPLAFLAAAGAATVPSAFIRVPGLVQAGEPGVLAIGRLALVATLVLLAVAVHRIWRKEGPVLKAMTGATQARWVSYHILWFGPALLVPVGLAIAALGGYYYTAMFLVGKAGETLWFVVMLVVLRDLLLRGLRVSQRRLRFLEALRYREEMQAQRAAAAAATTNGTKTGASDSESLPPLEEDKIDYGELGEQASRLVQLGHMIALLAGLWWIWDDVIPAFRFLNTIELPIMTSKLVEGVAQDVPLTLGDMGAGLLLGALALFAARNIPALLELTILQRLPMSRASRYAFTTLTQYLVAMVGIIITFNALGLQWSSIQWLVAALSVGLGFGLQEIVANFISGIILLFEQPIRVGDVVTVNNTTGTVTRIRIRATTIVNWERQELIIPNKAFITGELINWTLSDTVNRLTVTVGVAYDTDTRKAMQLMQDAAIEHPRIISDPAPRITFEGFGDNALNLVMRAYLSDLDNRLVTITELHQAILDKFRAAGIEIAFPQRDVHLDVSKPLELIMRRQPRSARPGSDAD